jgi:hypothetical protein
VFAGRRERRYGGETKHAAECVAALLRAFSCSGREQGVVVWLGTACFGAVLGWVCASLYRCGEPVWRELKVLSAIVLGAVLQASFGDAWSGAIAYALGLVVGAVLCSAIVRMGPAGEA